jgi:hypothetical protein
MQHCNPPECHTVDSAQVTPALCDPHVPARLIDAPGSILPSRLKLNCVPSQLQQQAPASPEAGPGAPAPPPSACDGAFRL